MLRAFLGGYAYNQARHRHEPKEDVMAGGPTSSGSDGKAKAEALGTWLAIGVGVGVALGVVFDQLALGIAIGAGIGIAIGSSWGQRTPRLRALG